MVRADPVVVGAGDSIINNIYIYNLFIYYVRTSRKNKGEEEETERDWGTEGETSYPILAN